MLCIAGPVYFQDAIVENWFLIKQKKTRGTGERLLKCFSTLDTCFAWLLEAYAATCALRQRGYAVYSTSCLSFLYGSSWEAVLHENKSKACAHAQTSLLVLTLEGMQALKSKFVVWRIRPSEAVEDGISTTVRACRRCEL